MGQDIQNPHSNNPNQNTNQPVNGNSPKESSPSTDLKSEEGVKHSSQSSFFQKYHKWIAALGAALLLVVVGLGLSMSSIKQQKQKKEDSSLNLIMQGELQTTPSPTSIPTQSVVPVPTPDYGEIVCHENEKYFVVVGNGKTPGFLVKYKTAGDQRFECRWAVNDADFVIGIEWSEFYLGLTSDFLLLDSGTGPGIRGLIIYDLSKREKVFTDGYESYPYQSAVTIQENSLIYWTGTDIEPTPENCPELEYWESAGLGAVVETRVKLNLSTLTKVELGEHQCMAEQ